MECAVTAMEHVQLPVHSVNSSAGSTCHRSFRMLHVIATQTARRHTCAFHSGYGYLYTSKELLLSLFYLIATVRGASWCPAVSPGPFAWLRLLLFLHFSSLLTLLIGCLSAAAGSSLVCLVTSWRLLLPV